MQKPTKEELLESDELSFDTQLGEEPSGSARRRRELSSPLETESLSFPGLRGDVRRHLERAELVARLAALPPAPRDQGRVELLVARGPAGERAVLREALLTADGGMPGDRWSADKKLADAQLATARADIARLIANEQPLELHGDNLYLDLDLSAANLPAGSTLRLGEALVVVTPKPHNGCKKWVQRFGLAPMKLNLAPEYRGMRLRGMYLRVVEDGLARQHDPVVVLTRGA